MKIELHRQLPRKAADRLYYICATLEDRGYCVDRSYHMYFPGNDVLVRTKPSLEDRDLEFVAQFDLSLIGSGGDFIQAFGKQFFHNGFCTTFGVRI